MRRLAVLSLVAWVGCGAKTGVRAPLRCDEASECPPVGDFCVESAACLAGYCATEGPPSCDDRSACTVDACDGVLGACTHVVRDEDGDGHGDAACGAEDCDDGDAAVHPGAPERCADGRDDDCDGRTDCSDLACAADLGCAGCTPEGCADGVDDDCDGIVDCADSDCAASLDCCVPAPERCDGLDQDCDGVADDGVPCWFLSAGDTVTDAPIEPFTTRACPGDWYAYDRPDHSSANPSPDLRLGDAVTIVPVAPPASCGGRGLAVIADTTHDGTGGRLEASFDVVPAEGALSVSDDPGECAYDGSTGRGTCRWNWESCCTDGMVLDHLVRDFCLSLSLTRGQNVGSLRVLDRTTGEIDLPLGTPVTICQRTVAARP